MDLKVLDAGALDGLFDALDQTSDEKCALGADATTVLDHLLAQLVTSSHDGLYCVEVLAQVQEGELRRLNTCILYPASECDLLVLVLGSVSEVGTRCARGLEVDGAAKWKFAIRSSRYIGGIIGGLFLTFSKLTSLRCSLLLCLLEC
jgi:hypothetical protein